MTMDLQTIVPFLSGDLLAKIFELLGVSSSGFPKVSMSKLRNSRHLLMNLAFFNVVVFLSGMGQDFPILARGFIGVSVMV